MKTKELIQQIENWKEKTNEWIEVEEDQEDIEISSLEGVAMRISKRNYKRFTNDYSAWNEFKEETKDFLFDLAIKYISTPVENRIADIDIKRKGNYINIKLDFVDDSNKIKDYEYENLIDDIKNTLINKDLNIFEIEY